MQNHENGKMAHKRFKRQKLHYKVTIYICEKGELAVNPLMHNVDKVVKLSEEKNRYVLLLKYLLVKICKYMH